MIYTIIAILSYIVYHATTMRQTEYVSGAKYKLIPYVLTSSIINMVVFCVVYMLYPYENDLGLFIAYVLLYFIEISYLSKRNFIMMLFGVLSFTINIFARRILVQAILALSFGISMGDVYNDLMLYFWVNVIPLLIAAPHIYYVQNKLKREDLDMIFTDKKNLLFSVNLMGSVCIFIIVVLSLINEFGDDPRYAVMYLLIGITTVISYYLANICAKVFSKLKLHVVKYEEISKNVMEETDKIENLEEQVLTDAFTGVNIREVAINKVEEYIALKKKFFVVFIDMDGLKSVNDEYGHAEGDIYILSVSNIIKDVFANDVISRLGGDEFLIVGNATDSFIAVNKTLQVYDRVMNIKTVHNKEYNTSISYGIVEVGQVNTRRAKDIIDEADKKMYEYKKSKKRDRKSMN